MRVPALDELDFMYRQLSSDMQEEYVSTRFCFRITLYLQERDFCLSPDLKSMIDVARQKADERPDVQARGLSRILL